jgi:hypothetical protein
LAFDDDGSCSFPGCQDPEAINYDPFSGCEAQCFYDEELVGDLNTDCVVNTEDLLLLLTTYGSNCP